MDLIIIIIKEFILNFKDSLKLELLFIETMDYLKNLQAFLKNKIIYEYLLIKSISFKLT
jgi:hypothetical protein